MEADGNAGFVPDPWREKREAAARRSLPKGFRPEAWRVRREFGRIPARRPPPPFKDAEPVGEAAVRVMRALDLPREDADAALVEKIWPDAAGPDVAAHARPGALRDGVLTVRVRGSAWLSELRREGPAEILPRLRRAFGEFGAACPVRSLRIVPDFG